MYINTNVPALFAENSLINTQNTLSNLQDEMSTGYQINTPANNPSGLAISNLMQGELGGINSAISNTSQATNLLNTANGGMQTDMQIVQQLQQLAVQASNSTNNTQDLTDIQNQINNLMTSLDNVAQTLNYNNTAVLNSGPTVSNLTAGTIAAVAVGADSGAIASGNYTVSVSYSTAGNGSDIVSVENSAGSVIAAGTVANLASVTGTINLQVVQGQNGNQDSFSITVNQASVVSAGTTGTSVAFSVTAGTQLEFQTGANQGDGNSISTQFGTFTSATLGLNNLSVLTVNSAQYAITQAQSALSILTNAQGAVGAQLDELNYASNNLQTESTNLQASQSSIMDANMATVTSQFAQQQILLQTGLQSLQAANSLPGMVLKLLG
ncbi:MAG: flagellin [Sulfobacillus benefaciens]|uniref:Flagellin n=1 Tax=Sulfobacillus benefaciens TaxID=453960 RepID=A0A2T2XIM1_9FIRM|nr:MAG: flagellin [Sulfobacillus benefaciens]